MSSNDFEERLRRQSMCRIPREWRGQILDAARRAADPQLPNVNPPTTSWWRELLWPCPQAWAGLAAVWMVIFSLNATSPEPARWTSTPHQAPAREPLMALRERQRMLAEFAGSSEAATLPKPRPPAPRSELSRSNVAV